jgi:dTMP kinase
MPPRNAQFIVLEGLDGAGTTTQAAKLHGHCTRHGVPGFLTNEPTSAPVGAFIRRLLTSREPGSDGSPYRPPESSMALLFAADRLAHSREIAAHLAAGEHVICDRYVFSSLAYQTLDASITPEWVIEINRGCAIPDVTVFLDVPVDECLRRLSGRAGATAIYETKPLLDAIANNYHRLLKSYQETYGRVVRLDGTRSIDEVAAAIIEAAQLD